MGDFEDVEGRITKSDDAGIEVKSAKGRSSYPLSKESSVLFEGGNESLSQVASHRFFPGDRVRVFVRDGKALGVVFPPAPAAGAYDRDSAWEHWTRRFTSKELGAKLRERDGTRNAADPTGVAVTSRGASSRARTVVVSTPRGTLTLKGLEIRFALSLPENSVQRRRAGTGRRARLHALRPRLGHGVGLRQTGVRNGARAGRTARSSRTTIPARRSARRRESLPNHRSDLLAGHAPLLSEPRSPLSQNSSSESSESRSRPRNVFRDVEEGRRAARVHRGSRAGRSRADVEANAVHALLDDPRFPSARRPSCRFSPSRLRSSRLRRGLRPRRSVVIGVHGLSSSAGTTGASCCHRCRWSGRGTCRGSSRRRAGSCRPGRTPGGTEDDGFDVHGRGVRRMRRGRTRRDSVGGDRFRRRRRLRNPISFSPPWNALRTALPSPTRRPGRDAQVPRAVADAMTRYLLEHNANTHWVYRRASRRTRDRRRAHLPTSWGDPGDRVRREH